MSRRLRIAAGLSETSASFSDGGVGSGWFANALRWRAAVRCEEGDGEEERLRARREPADELHRLSVVDVGLVVRGARAVGDEPSVLVQRVVVEAIRGRVGGAVPLAPAGGDLGRP